MLTFKVSNRIIIFSYFVGTFMIACVVGFSNVYFDHTLTPYIKFLIDLLTVINFALIIYINRYKKFKLLHVILYLIFISYFTLLFLVNSSNQPLNFVLTEYRPILLLALLSFVALLKFPEKETIFPKSSIK